jgi:hypothetical protein
MTDAGTGPTEMLWRVGGGGSEVTVIAAVPLMLPLVAVNI